MSEVTRAEQLADTIEGAWLENADTEVVSVDELQSELRRLSAVEAELQKQNDALFKRGMDYCDRIERQSELLQQAKEALEDMNNGWKYIRDSHGDLYGVGWDRAQDKAEAALSAINEWEKSNGA